MEQVREQLFITPPSDPRPSGVVSTGQHVVLSRSWYVDVRCHEQECMGHMHRHYGARSR
jgi:hypothetical protein